MRLGGDRDAWRIAWFLTLALHAGAVFLFRGVTPSRSPGTIHQPEPVRIVFKNATTKEPGSAEPKFFSELPPDREDATPSKAALLSNVTSRARDAAPGGDAAMPRMLGQGDVPMVKLEPEGGPEHPPAAPSAAQATESGAPRSAESSQQLSSEAEHKSVVGGGAPISRRVGRRDTTRLMTGQAARALKGAVGTSDIHQPEMANPDGNAPLAGDVSLNTTAWNYAPWLQRFGRQLMRRWFPPPAYSLGILKEGGWALIEVEISPSGEILRLDLQEEQGHPSLILAAQSALRSMAPIEPLPADFPEPTLILRVRMIYPRMPLR